MGQFDPSSLPSYQALQNIKFDNFKDIDPALLEAIGNDLKQIEDKEFDDIRDMYKNLKPGADLESDSSYRRDIMDLQQRQGQRRSDTIARARYDFIKVQLQASDQEMQKLIALAQLDTESIMFQLKLDAIAAQEFKDSFSQMAMLQSMGGM